MAKLKIVEFQEILPPNSKRKTFGVISVSNDGIMKKQRRKVEKEEPEFPFAMQLQSCGPKIYYDLVDGDMVEITKEQYDKIIKERNG